VGFQVLQMFVAELHAESPSTARPLIRLRLQKSVSKRALDVSPPFWELRPA
jgi:hypothetical protein